MASVIEDIKKSLKEEKLVIGADSTLKGIRTGKFEKVYISANCPERMKADIERLANMADVEVIDTGLENTELGDVCKKPFAIAVMGLLKQ